MMRVKCSELMDPKPVWAAQYPDSLLLGGRIHRTPPTTVLSPLRLHLPLSVFLFFFFNSTSFELLSYGTWKVFSWKIKWSHYFVISWGKSWCLLLQISPQKQGSGFFLSYGFLLMVCDSQLKGMFSEAGPCLACSLLVLRAVPDT